MHDQPVYAIYSLSVSPVLFLYSDIGSPILSVLPLVSNLSSPSRPRSLLSTSC